uniref:Uncharacterized protein n=1 Tax=viral metagenome TaxID=1070528 RepID=A0A6C0H0W1_9ZZZZ
MINQIIINYYKYIFILYKYIFILFVELSSNLYHKIKN